MTTYTAAQLTVLNAIAQGEVSFFDDGIAVDSTTWRSILAEDTGVTVRVIDGLIDKGVFWKGEADRANGTTDYGLWLTEKGVAAIEELRVVPFVAAPAREGHTDTAPRSWNSHEGHDHPKTPAGRAACRKARA